MKILLVNNGTRYLKNLERLLNKHSLTIISSKDIPFYDKKRFDLLILSGGHKKNIVDNKDFYKEEIKLIKTFNKPVIGICLGFELIAFIFRAKLKRMRVKEKGMMSIRFIDKEELFAEMETAQVFEKHRWVVEKLSSNLKGIAVSKDGYEIIKHKTRPIYGFQFHPEVFVNKLEGSRIFNRLLEIIKKD